MNQSTSTLKWVSVVALSLTILISSTHLLYPWWWSGGYDQIMHWHPKFGGVIWYLRGFLILIWILSCIIASIYWIKQVGVNHLIRTSKAIWRRLLSSKIASSSVFISYITLSSFIGEQHPFTNVPMYNYLPSEAYVFFLADESGELVPLNEVSSISGGSLSHMCYNGPRGIGEFGDGFCGDIDTLVARQVYQQLMAGSSQQARKLAFYRSCISTDLRFGDRIQLLHAPD